MNVKHLSQERLFCESVAHDIKMNVKASRTPRTYEVALALGFYEQFWVFHAAMMAQSGWEARKLKLAHYRTRRTVANTWRTVYALLRERSREGFDYSRCIVDVP